MAVFDNKEIGLRLKELATDLHFNSSRQFALALKADVSYWGKVESGEKPISEKYMQVLRDEHNVNLVWLLFGVGEKFGPIGTKEKSGNQKLPDLDLLTQMKKQADDLKSNFDKLFSQVPELSKENEDPGLLFPNVDLAGGKKKKAGKL